jgi:predicted naringenin-chalcone synthase
MFLHALATATPDNSFTQRECFALAMASPALTGRLDRRARLMFGAILRGDSGVDTRQFATNELDKLFTHGPDELNGIFRQAAPELAVRALAKALPNAGLAPTELDALVVCTCTGYLCPGVSSYVAEMIGLKSDAWLQDLVGLGCGAAIPALRASSAIIHSNPDAVVACIAVEVCSAAFYLDNDPGVIISACLFGDGAAASIWRSTPAQDSLRCHGFSTIHEPAHRDRIRFEQRDGKLRNLLHPSVPELASRAVRELYERSHDPELPPIEQIISHGGGKDVLAALSDTFPQHDFAAAKTILRRHGNMSSPSVLFALQEALLAGAPRNDADWWLTSFGAGFSAHSCRLSAV